MSRRLFHFMTVLLLTALPGTAQTSSPVAVPEKNTLGSYEERIAQALRNKIPGNRDQELINIASDQAEAKRYSDAKSTILSYVEDKDWGLASLVTMLIEGGLYEEARSTLELIGNCERRAIAFGHIAEAQVKADDISGARGTLLAGLQDALREENPCERSTLSVIVTGMAEAGMTDSVRSTLKLFDTSDLHGVYLSVARAQASRGDLEEAKWTFRQAVKLEQKNGYSVLSETNLVQIAKSQADVGLLKEARETAAMIRNITAREVAERHISLAERKEKK